MKDRNILTRLGLGLAIGGLVGLIAVLLYQVQWVPLAAASERVNDLVFQPSRASPSSRIVLVTIDDSSLDQIGRWPWSRGVFADLVDRLAADGARVIGIDVLFTAPNASDPEGDTKFASALKRAGNVVLASAAVFEGSQPESGFAVVDRFEVPLPEFASAARRVAHVNVYGQSDVVREAPMLVVAGKDVSLGFAAAVLAEYRGEPPGSLSFKPGDSVTVGGARVPIGERGQTLVNYLTAPGSYPSVSAADLVEGKVPAGTFNGRIALVGSWARSLKDRVATPVGEMYGLEVNANLLQSLLADQMLTQVPRGLVVAALLLLCLVSGAIFAVVPAWIAAGLGLTETVAVVVAWGLAVELGNLASLAGIDQVPGLLFDLAYPVLAIWLCFGGVIGARFFRSYRAEQRGRRLFGRFVSKQVLQEIMATDDRDLHNPRGQKREITVLFADIRGFTSLSERMGAEGIFAVLNEYLGAITQAIFRHEGTLNKFLGDAVLAIYNAPTPQPDHALRAVRTAVEMQSALASVRLHGVAPGEVACGIGVNTGFAMVGTVGTEERMEYTCIGDAVNVASRLQSFAEGGQVLITASTYEQVKAWVDARPLEPVQLKGKAEPLQVFQVLDMRDAS